jgi:rsbT co-antagonist protein RsbR
MAYQDQVSEMLHKFTLGENDLALIRAVGPKVMSEIDKHLEDFYLWLSNYDEYDFFFAGKNERLQRVKHLQVQHWQSFFDANIDQDWIASRRHVGAVHAHINLPNDIYFAGVTCTSKSITDRLRELDKAVKNMEQTVGAVTKLIFLDAYLVIEEIARIQREKIEAGSKALMEMSTPVTPIWEGILLLPLVGIIDSERTQDIMSKTLNKIAETRAKVFVLDISGVGAMDTAVANQLIKITRATQLMGCETIISGVSPTIARTLVELGINVGEVKTTATLRDSFEWALKNVGMERQLVDTGRGIQN